MLLPDFTHAGIAHAFAKHYRKNFKVIRTRRNVMAVLVKGDDRQYFEPDVKKYHLRRVVRTYLDWLFDHSPEPKPLALQNHRFLTDVVRELEVLLYDPEGIQ